MTEAMENAVENYREVAKQYEDLMRESKVLEREFGACVSALSKSFSDLLVEDEYLSGIIWAFVRFEGQYIVLMALHNKASDRLSELLGDMDRTHWGDLERTPDGDAVKVSFYVRDGEIYLEIHRDYFDEVCEYYWLHRFSTFNLQKLRNDTAQSLAMIDDLMARMNE